MKLLIVAASQRAGSQSVALARHIETLVPKIEGLIDGETRLIDLSDHREALWAAEPEMQGADALTLLRDAALWADALVFVVPEWSGMAPPLAKNFFLIMRPLDLAHKPGVIVAVSAGSGGAYPIAELRMGSYKNTKLCWLPDHVIIRGTDLQYLSDNNVEPPAVNERLCGAMRMLSIYSHALQAVRDDLNAVSRRWPYGM